MLSGLTWETLMRKNIKKQKRLVFRLGALFSLKNIICLYFSPIAKLWTRKKKIMVMVVMVVKWNGSKTEVVIFNKTNSFWFTPEAKRETTLSDRCSEILRNHNWQEPYLVLSDKQCSW